MNFDQIAIVSILLLVLALFIWGKLRYDIVTLLALGVATLLGLVPAEEMFSGFGHPATVTVAIVLVLSAGLTRSGAVESITSLVEPLATSPTLHLTGLVLIAAILSMFMNNVGALALIMPVAIQSTMKANRSPATILMPLSFGSILGGLATLIGTPPNIIISLYRQQVSGEPFQLFDFTPVGAAVAGCGILFIVAIGWRLVKVRKTTAGSNLYEIESYLFEIKVAGDSELIGKSLRELEPELQDYNLNILSLLRGRLYQPIIPRQHILQADDLLIVDAPQEEVDRFVSKYKLDLLGADNARETVLNSSTSTAMEVVVAPNSRIVGRSVGSIRFNTYYNVNLLAVASAGKSHQGRLKHVTIQMGDVLLLHGEKDDLEEAIGKLGCYPLADQGIAFGKRKFALTALALFATAILLSVSGLVSLQLSLGAAALAMVLLNIIPLRELYDHVDWPVIVLLGGMIPIGSALQETGSTQLIVDGIMGISAGVPAFVLLALVLIVTMTLSDILNNAATAILMAPIGVAIASALHANPDTFLMAVAIGASCAFLTPIGHQNNALVMGPGGYQFGDYWRVGLPLEIIIVLTSLPMLLWVWPLYPN